MGWSNRGGTHYLVMELVPGETLRERVAGERAVPVEEALNIAKQIAEALEAAHGSEKGIIHRDLKPANVKVTPEGRVKVLDFGLAKAFAAEASSQDFSNSPTLSAMPTMQGVIMGTAAYMSPEQAKGKPVTKATDTFAFGAVLYELLTGQQAFQGEDIGDILAAVVKTEPDWSRLPADTPPAIRTLLKRCLRKDRRQRFQDATDVRIEIEEALGWMAEGGSQASAATAIPQRKSRERLAWAVAAGLCVAFLAALGLGAFAYFGGAPQDTQAIRFFISPPDGWELTLFPGGASEAPLAVSPDGQRVALVATGADGRSLLWVRPLDTLAAQSLAGTEGASSPFWSPDSRFLGFFADGKLKKIDISGGPPITLCDAPNDNAGGTWSQDGVIVFDPAALSALQRVSAAGGVATAATVLAEGEVRHNRPFFLPDSRYFLYETDGTAAGRQIYVTSLDATERKLLLNSDSSNVVYSQGHLLFLRETTLMAQPFDTERLELTGEAFPIAEQIRTHSPGEAHAYFSASESGVLVYQTGEVVGGSELTWFDRSGKQTGVLGDRAAYNDVWLSPDGRRVSVSIQSGATGGATRDIWIYDVARGLRTRFTFDATDESAAIWSPDSSRIVVNSNRKGNYDLYLKPASGAGTEEVLLEGNFAKYAQNWSADGRFLLYRVGSMPQRDIFVLPLSGDRKPSPFVQTQFDETLGQFSPDGRWVAYQSNESGQFEIHVAPFPGPGGKWQVSTGGGIYAKWSSDGRELFYLAPDNRLMAVAVNGEGEGFEVGAVKPLFETRPVLGLGPPYNVTADDQRFLINTIPEEAASAPITVVVNWMAQLRQ